LGWGPTEWTNPPLEFSGVRDGTPTKIPPPKTSTPEHMSTTQSTEWGPRDLVAQQTTATLRLDALNCTPGFSKFGCTLAERPLLSHPVAPVSNRSFRYNRRKCESCASPLAASTALRRVLSRVVLRANFLVVHASSLLVCSICKPLTEQESDPTTPVNVSSRTVQRVGFAHVHGIPSELTKHCKLPTARACTTRAPRVELNPPATRLAVTHSPLAP
jgi:hypothetical protein